MCTSASSQAGWAAGSGASCGWAGLGQPTRHLLRSRGLLCWMEAGHFQALPPARSVLSRELRRKGPVCELRRALATSETCRVQYYPQYRQHSAMVGLSLEVILPQPDSGRRCARVGTSSAPLRWPMQPNRTPARTHSPETHLELHDPLADHREQPRRQRDQLRRKLSVRLSVRHTGGDRRQRLPVPREQHRPEQLQPLQRRIRPFARARARAGSRRREGAL
jgi:hypothetical protein